MNKILVTGCLLAAVFACKEQTEPAGSSGVKNPDEIHNPNGDSELALVMRNMHFEAGKVREKLLAGEEVDLSELKSLASRISTATPTPGNHFDSSFYEFSGVINEHVQSLDASSEKVVEFNAIVSTCVSCHQTTCPGPIKKIKKLTIES